MNDYRTGSKKLSYRCNVFDGKSKLGSMECSSATISMTAELESTDASVKFSANIETPGIIRDGKRTVGEMDWARYNFDLELIDGSDFYQLGVFVPQQADLTDNSGKIYQATGYDKLILAKIDCITERNLIAKNSRYLDTIVSLLISSGLTDVVYDDSTAVFASDRDDWEIGTSKLAIVNQLLREISFRSAEIDSSGTVHLRQYSPASVGNIQHVYKPGQASIIENPLEIGSNLFDIPNIWIGTVSNPDLAVPLYYKYINDDPMSHTSVSYTGKSKVKAMSYDNIATQADLETEVTRQAFQDMQGVETVKFSTALEPDHGVGDTVALELPQYNGILTETEWEINLEEMTMTHTGKKVVSY